MHQLFEFSLRAAADLLGPRSRPSRTLAELERRRHAGERVIVAERRGDLVLEEAPMEETTPSRH